MKPMWTALALTALVAAGQESAEGPEVRVYLIDANGRPAPLRGISATVLVAGKEPGTPMIVEVPVKNDEPGLGGVPQPAKVEGTSMRAEAVVRPRGPSKGGPGRKGPYFRAVLDKGTTAFRVVFVIDGEKRVARGFSAEPRPDELPKASRDAEAAIAARDVERSKAALERLAAALEAKPEGDPHRALCATGARDARAALDAGDWEKVSRSFESCREACAECAERCAPAPPDERRRP